jgi:hypothetical protein
MKGGRLWAVAGAVYRDSLVTWAKHFCRLILEIVEQDPDAVGFQRLPHRWVVDRNL